LHVAARDNESKLETEHERDEVGRKITLPVGEAVLIYDVAALDVTEGLHAFLWVAGWPPAVAKRLAVRTTTSPIRRMGTSERMAGGESSRPESSVA